MRTILLTILLFFLQAAQGQGRKDTVLRYFNINLEPVKKKEAVFIGITVRDPLGWNCLIYDDSMRVLVRGKYMDEDCKVKEGWFTYFYADGNRAASGKFENNIRVDYWRTWHANGMLKDSAYYANGNVHGPSRSFHVNGKPAAEGSYMNGQMDGAWSFYHENGQASTREFYKGGKLADLECFDSLGISKGMNCAIARPPALVGRYGGIRKYLADSLRTPGLADGEPVEGIVTVQYVITKEGKMENFRILSSDHPLLTGEVARVFSLVGAWYPAVSHGRNIDHAETLKIPFFADGSASMESFEPIPWDY